MNKYLGSSLGKEFKFFNFISGECLILHSTTTDCQNLPNEWLNRTSSLLTDACIVVFTQFDCVLDDKQQIFLSPEFKFFDVYSSIPDTIPNYDCYGTRYNDSLLFFSGELKGKRAIDRPFLDNLKFDLAH